MFMSLRRSGAALDQSLIDVTWIPLADMRDTHPAGQISGETVEGGLTFALSDQAVDGEDVLACHPCKPPGAGALLRIDEVCFPVGAIAHRHTHTGTGIRYLVRGDLRIEAEDHTQTMHAGDSWFEPAASPVRAVSLQSQGVSSFLRAMVIPAEFEGKSTFGLANPDDAGLPRLQVTHRHVDLPF